MFGKKAIEKKEDFEMKKLKEKVLEEVKEKVKRVIIDKILEEHKIPGNYDTRIEVARISDMYTGMNQIKTTPEVKKFINDRIYHRVQIINISSKSDKSILEEYIITYWVLEDQEEIYKKIKIEKFKEYGIKID